MSSKELSFVKRLRGWSHLVSSSSARVVVSFITNLCIYLLKSELRPYQVPDFLTTTIHFLCKFVICAPILIRIHGWPAAMTSALSTLTFLGISVLNTFVISSCGILR